MCSQFLFDLTWFWTENLCYKEKIYNIQSRHYFIRIIHIYFLQIFWISKISLKILQQILFLVIISVISWPPCTIEENNRADVTNNHHKGPHITRGTHSYLRRPLSSCSKPGFTFFLIVQYFYSKVKSLSLHSLSIYRVINITVCIFCSVFDKHIDSSGAPKPSINHFGNLRSIKCCS